MTVNIEGLNRADVLVALYNASRPQGMGFLHYNPTPMQRNEAEQLLTECDSFDYLKGRVMKLRLKVGENAFEERGYDRDNGAGAAQKVINALRAGNQSAIKQQHKENVQQSAALTLNRVNEETRETNHGNVKEVRLGLSDVKDKLKPAIQAAKNANR